MCMQTNHSNYYLFKIFYTFCMSNSYRNSFRKLKILYSKNIFVTTISFLKLLKQKLKPMSKSCTHLYVFFHESWGFPVYCMCVCNQQMYTWICFHLKMSTVNYCYLMTSIRKEGYGYNPPMFNLNADLTLGTILKGHQYSSTHSSPLSIRYQLIIA